MTDHLARFQPHAPSDAMTFGFVSSTLAPTISRIFACPVRTDSIGAADRSPRNMATAEVAAIMATESTPHEPAIAGDAPVRSAAGEVPLREAHHRVLPFWRQFGISILACLIVYAAVRLTQTTSTERQPGTAALIDSDTSNADCREVPQSDRSGRIVAPPQLEVIPNREGQVATVAEEPEDSGYPITAFPAVRTEPALAEDSRPVIARLDGGIQPFTRH